MIEIFLAFLGQSSAGEFRPTTIDPYALCSCASADKSNLVSFTAIASDAEVALAEDGRSAKPRQATIFKVVKGAGDDVPERAKVFHLTDPAKCGVRFDYGKRYEIVAAKKENGELETSYCLMPKPAAD